MPPQMHNKNESIWLILTANTTFITYIKTKKMVLHPWFSCYNTILKTKNQCFILTVNIMIAQPQERFISNFPETLLSKTHGNDNPSPKASAVK